MQTSPTRKLHITLVAAAALVVTALVLAPAAATAQGPPSDWPPEPKNLKVLPADTDPRQLIETMKGFTAALGVRCQFCHVGEEGQPIFSFDFASDEKEHKKVARLMLQMVQDINKNHMSKLDDEGSAHAVECITCHHGTAHPEQLDDLLVDVATNEGTEAAVARYSELRRKYYGGQSYDFGEQTLVRTGGTLASQGDLEGAASLIELNLKHFPKSAMTFGALAQVRHRQGDTEGAIEALQKVLEIDPKNSRVQEMLKGLEEAQKAKQAEEAAKAAAEEAQEGTEAEPEEGGEGAAREESGDGSGS